MSIPTYTLGYPPDGSSLGNTKAVIRDNLDGTFQVFSVDHQDQNEVGAGSHTKVSLKNTTGTTTPTLPPNIFGGGYETLYSQPAGAPPLGSLGEIFYSRGGGAGIQLTGPGTPTKATNGYTFLAGGIMLQWGQSNVNASGATTTINFSPTFSTACLNVQITCIQSTATSRPSANNVYLTSAAPTTSQFVVSNSSSGTVTKIFWVAIGY